MPQFIFISEERSYFKQRISNPSLPLKQSTLSFFPRLIHFSYYALEEYGTFLLSLLFFNPQTPQSMVIFRYIILPLHSTMNTFSSPPTAKSPSVKFSYISPPHQKINIFSPFSPNQTNFQNLSALRPVKNMINSPRMNERQIDKLKKGMMISPKWQKSEKQNLLDESKKSVSQSLIISNKKQEDGVQTTEMSFCLSDLATRKKKQQIFIRDQQHSQSTDDNQLTDQKLKYSTVFKFKSAQKQNQTKVFNFSKVKPKNRRVQVKLSNASIKDFIIGQMIGKGSIGRVFLAKHLKTGFYFALKVIKKIQVKDIDQLAFGIKCHILLNHPNLAQLYACFSDESSIYLLMEICIDGNLSKYRKKIKHDEERDYIIMGVAKGVQYMHNYFLRHGDLKLQNILINHGFPKITDFDCIFNGKQKLFKQIRRKSKLWGSPAYFSPGMMRQNTFTLDDDIWSLGIIMYEIYCNAHPFNLKDTEDLTNIVDKGMNPFPKNIKESAKMLITQMLIKDRESRITIDQILKQSD